MIPKTMHGVYHAVLHRTLVRLVLLVDFLPIVLSFLAVLVLAFSVFPRRDNNESASVASVGRNHRNLPSALVSVFLFRAGLVLLFFAFAAQASVNALRERIGVATQGVSRQRGEESVEAQPPERPDDERAATAVEQAVEKFRAPRSEARAYFAHASIAVRVPYPKDWITYVEQNDDKEFRIRFYPRESELVGYALRRSRRTLKEFASGIRDADVSQVRRSGMVMEHIRVPPHRNPFDESSAPLSWWINYTWHDGTWQYVLSGAEDDPFFEAAAMLLKFPDTVVPTADTGVIEGSLSYPSEVVLPQEVCAVDVSTGQRFCTSERVYDDVRYAYGVGYRLQVPPGTYVVSSRNEEYGYEARYLGCVISAECTATAPASVVVSAGATVSGIDPQEWIPTRDNARD